MNFQLKLSRGGSPWSNGPHDVKRIALSRDVPESGTVRDPLVSLSEDRGGWVHNRAGPVAFVQQLLLLGAHGGPLVCGLLGDFCGVGLESDFT